MSRDVEFYEEAMWNWETKEKSIYDFLSYFDDEEENIIQDTFLSHTPYSPTSSMCEKVSSGKLGKIRSFHNIYDETE